MPTHDILYKDEAYKIIGAAMRVHSILGCGFLEQVYQEALEIEFEKQHIPFQREVSLAISYDGKILKKQYVADFTCYDKIIVELKAIQEFHPFHEAQLLNYMQLTKIPKGILINFNCNNIFNEGQKTFVNEHYKKLPLE